MKKLISFIFISLFIFQFSCKKDDVPVNPYDGITHNNSNPTSAEPDPNSIAGLHKNIFFPRCANPGCHDGTFEPDYRTIESTYSTLIYQPVNKVTLDSLKFFSYRVIPHDVANSFIIERLTTTTPDYMPSNGERLTQSEIDHVKNWINNGCPDINGNLPAKPDLQPNIVGYVALDASFNRLDTARVGGLGYNPFYAPVGITMTIAFVALDTADGTSAVDPSNFTIKQISFSTDKNDFTTGTTIIASSYLATYTAWLVNVPTGNWAMGTTVYFRISVNDGHHTSNSTFPRDESLDYYKTLYAFKVQ